MSRLFRGEPGLRRFATDASLPAEAKQGMVQQVFKGRRRRADARRCSTDAVGRRWTLSRDLPDVLERLSEIARGPLGRRQGRPGRPTSCSRCPGIVDGNPELRDALSDPGALGRRQGGAARLAARRQGARRPRSRWPSRRSPAPTARSTAALATYRRVAAETQGETVATVRVARPLAAADQQRLRRRCSSSQYDTHVHLNVVVDPEVLGGLRVEIGDEVIDGTIASRLDDARRRLAG